MSIGTITTQILLLRKFLHLFLVNLPSNYQCMKSRHSLYILFTVVAAWVFYSCASIGNPEGGPQDKMPPIFVKSSPEPNAVNCKKNKIELTFDEIVQLKDPSNKIVVSPAQTEMPKMSASGKKVTIELVDSLLPNTTYTLDFSNSIQDNNEGNPLENFAFAFSTGEAIDSLRVSGIVLDSRSLEPQQNVIVGLQSNMSDTAFTKVKLERIARTDSRGRFIVRNVRPGSYRVFALNDLDRDYKFGNPTEDIAFYDSIVVPWCRPEAVADTAFALDGKTVDSVRTVNKTRFYPNDILLSMFNENRKSQYLQNNSRIDSTRLSIIFAAPSDTLPELSIVNKPQPDNSWYTLERSAHNDTLTYWIRRPELVSSDSLNVALRYLKTDSTDNLAWTTDTLRFNFQREKPKKEKKKKDEPEDTLPKIQYLSLSLLSGGTQEVYAPITIQSQEPIERLDSAAFHLEMKQDTLWTDITDYRLAYRDTTLDRRTLQIRHKWEPGEQYRIRIDSLGITNIYGVFNKTYETTINVRKLEEYGNLIFNIPAAGDSAVVELLNSSDSPVLAVPVRGGKAEFINMLPAKYYARLYFDRNRNGKYDTGNYALRLQPEETYYYPGVVNLKKNWDVEQTWDIYETAVDAQKPEEIKKNKPEKKKWETESDKNKKSEYDEDGEYGDGYDEYGNPTGYGSGNSNSFNSQKLRSLGSGMRTR